MAIILCVYTSSTFREIRLPVMNNSDYSIALYKNIYGLVKDVILKLEVIHEEWVFVEDSAYSIMKENEGYERQRLQNGDVLQVYTENEVISVVVRKVSQPFHVFKKISITDMNRITIGKNETNLIRYDYSGLVSREHAALSKGAGGWQITNTGANGICVNSQLIRGSYDLKFGDYINIIGLHIVYLGDILAIDAADHDLRLSEALKEYEYDADAQEQTGNPQKRIVADSRILIHRAPRNIEKIETQPIEIESPPALNRAKKQPMLMTIGPSFSMAIPMVLGCLLMTSGSGASSIATYSGLIMAVSSAATGVLWAILGLRHQK
ncbi:MAG: FHA domain-containing protein [Lachnospiraceae bacterium]|nr:FHA domain-containing protein [Lachnospiraceae bacterium]